MRGSTKGGNFEQLSGGLTGLADLFRQHAVETGTLDSTTAALGRFAVRGGGAPFEQNAQGSVLNAPTGAVDQSSPLARAFIGATDALGKEREARAAAPDPGLRYKSSDANVLRAAAAEQLGGVYDPLRQMIVAVHGGEPIDPLNIRRTLMPPGS